MSNMGEIKENLTAQVYELEALQSVYPDELKLGDHGVLADINDFINNRNNKLPLKLEYTIDISMTQSTLELQVSLPSEYPNANPQVYVRSSELDRTEQMNLNKSLMSFIDTKEKGDPFVYELISWLQDNADKYLNNTNKIKKISDNEGNKESLLEFVRYWVYSHHIYNKTKRREIITMAKENCLTGFSLAGKPGIICVEGALNDCEYWWQQVKVMNWQKIFVKFIEKEEVNNNNTDFSRKFPDFQEISFPTFDCHNDMGHLLKYLTEHHSQHVFKELFGIEGKVA